MHTLIKIVKIPKITDIIPNPTFAQSIETIVEKINTKKIKIRYRFSNIFPGTKAKVVLVTNYCLT